MQAQHEQASHIKSRVRKGCFHVSYAMRDHALKERLFRMYQNNPL